MVPDWRPELYKPLWRSWIKAVFASLFSTGSKSRPARGLPSTQCCPSHARRRAARTLRGAAQAGQSPRGSPSPSPRPRARGPLTSLAEKRRRLFSVATEVTPLSRPGSGSYPRRTRPTSGWRLSRSSWLFLCPRDRKILRSRAHLERGPRTASPRGRGLHRARACPLGGGQSRSPGVRSRTAQPAPVPRSPGPCAVHFSRAWAPQSPYRRSQPPGLSRPALRPPCPARRWSPESRGESNLPPGETAPTRSTSGFTPKPARKGESQIRVAHFVSLLRVKTCIPKSS